MVLLYFTNIRQMQNNISHMEKTENAMIRAIITGSTGMVGEGVLYECLQHTQVESVLVINRKSCGIIHAKLKEIIHTDFYDLRLIEEHLKGYNACYFCLGVSSLGMKEPEYFKISYTLTINFAQTLSRLNDGMTFCYISGAGTDGSEKGKIMWARIKGKTENDLMKLPFKGAYAFRPALIQPTKGLKNALTFYKYIEWIFPFARLLFPGYFVSLKEVGLAMINVAVRGYNKQVLENKDIVTLSTMS
jgi:hypothetical protein